jgi:prepilin-type N-terminal cleavage/methylation domain-containing protein
MTNIHSSRGAVPDAVRCGRGFSLIEIMVTVTLLAVIILGLVTMFNQTQRAFTTSLNQVDVLEGGRTAADMIAREMEQNTPSYYSNVYNFYVIPPQNFIANNYVWPLVNSPDVRTNAMEQLFFLTRYNQQWNAVGFEVEPNSLTNGVGTLYRYSSNNVPLPNLAGQLNNFLFAASSLSTNTNFNRIIDGVVDFRIRVFSANGNLIIGRNAALTITAITNQNSQNEYSYQFRSNAVPAYVEVELGILETRTLERYRSYSNSPSLALNYLTNHAAQVHIFRQRIPIRAVDTAAYH